MTDFSPLESALHESTPERIASSLRYLRKADAVMAALMPLSANTQAPPAAADNGDPLSQEALLRRIAELQNAQGVPASLHGNPCSAAVPDALIEIGRRLAEDRKRNDHHTADPIYTVQREVRIYGLDADYAERFAWIEDSELCASDLSERLERRFHRGWTIPERYRRVGYCTRWEFVDAYLSYDAAKERVEYEGRKHHGTYRTYVESGCRNHEWKALQAWLLAATQAPPAAVPAGWRAVPLNPTPEMRAAFLAEAGAPTFLTHTTMVCADFKNRYRAMLAAKREGE